MDYTLQVSKYNVIGKTATIAPIYLFFIVHLYSRLVTSDVCALKQTRGQNCPQTGPAELLLGTPYKQPIAPR